MREDFKNPENWEKMELNTVKFVFQQTEKLLLETTETAKILTNRSLTILQFSLALLIGLIGLLFTDAPAMLRGICVIALSAAAIVTWECLKIYRPLDIRTIGNSPENIVSSEKLLHQGDAQEKVFLISSIHSMRDSIEFNISENKIRSRAISHIMTGIKYTGLLIGLYSLIFSLSLQQSLHS